MVDGINQAELSSSNHGWKSLRAQQREVFNKTGFRGVYWDDEHGRWRAEITYLGKRYKLGRFRSAESAARAYDDAAIKFYGEDSFRNYRDSDNRWLLRK